MATPVRRLFRPPPSPARPSRPAVSPTYRPRRPTATPLYPVVQHHLETFLARAAEADPLGNGVPWWVERDFRAYLRCGILAHGFARVRCEDCGHERLIPFSCKGRGICPSCNTRRMAELAAHLTDHVLPHLAARQWVLSVPKRLRPFLHHNPDIAGAVLRIFLRAMRTTLRRATPGAPADAQLGAVSFLHRFGSSLNPHFHLHLVVLDGVFSQTSDGDTRTARFHEATLLQPEHWTRLQGVVQLERVMSADMSAVSAEYGSRHSGSGSHRPSAHPLGSYEHPSVLTPPRPFTLDPPRTTLAACLSSTRSLPCPSDPRGPFDYLSPGIAPATRGGRLRIEVAASDMPASAVARSLVGRTGGARGVEPPRQHPRDAQGDLLG
jgi:hypothetical protein